MAYRTEMGLYFSYYKTLVSAPTFVDGLYEIMHDNVTEYGHTINTLQRFNLYPEVILGAAYRIMKNVSSTFHWKIEHCWKVNRGNGLPPVESCDGIGSVLPSIFLLGVVISDTYLGGILAAASFLFNHGEATRVQWTPPLRESFAYPIFIFQMVALSASLKWRFPERRIFMILTLCTTLFLLFWQFSQFALTTQLGSIFATYALDFITPAKLSFLLKTFTASFLISSLLLFGNSLLVNSLFSTSLLTLWIIYASRPLLQRITFRPLYVILNIALYLTSVLGLKWGISKLFNIRDDTHIADILFSKFTKYATFHTRLYTCAQEFDFIEYDTIRKLTQSWLLPICAISFVLLFIYLYRNDLCAGQLLWRKQNDDEKAYSEIIYNAIQLICFSIMAWIIMRLKLFATPHLCAFSSLIAYETFWIIALRRRLKFAKITVLIIIFAGMCYQGPANIQEQLNMRGEFSNPEQEDLFQWISDETNAKAVFAGSMAVMANVKLSTGRPIANHPHYEDEGIRNRTLHVYSMYSRKPLSEVYDILKSLSIAYYIFQPSQCTDSHPKAGCTYIEMWNLEDPVNSYNAPVCNFIVDAIATGKDSKIYPFKVVYVTPASSYAVIKL
ncbi:q-cell neuroblast polarization domain-containing protein [Ditylenchus destructor]|uniref:Q-cell neuroblast polarization domain-containing protein n=1 Tax=Ditylenchus destructor TaxID=166010 RepID=A0AAD4NIQ5_9BILA|nr:q-cell neuroblast polarization domain-containing protein [Ditylenchus destructor]